MDTRFRDSVVSGDTPAVAAILESGVPVDALDRYGDGAKTPADLAADRGVPDLQ